MLRRHSQEPWKPAGPEVRTTNGEKIALVLGQFEDMVERRDRIIACVNACAGIPTDALKHGVIGDLCKMADVALHSARSLRFDEADHVDVDAVNAALSARDATHCVGHEA